MIVKPKDIYLDVAEKHKLPIELVASIGDLVFQETRSILNNPIELAYELPELGTFNIRFRKFELYFESFQNRLDNNDQDAIALKELNTKLYLSNKSLYEKMQEYRNDKAETKQKRNEQNNSIQSSED